MPGDPRSAALANSEGGPDPVDAAACDARGAATSAMKGALAAVTISAQVSPDASTITSQLEAHGLRVQSPTEALAVSGHPRVESLLGPLLKPP
jgi:hypothetical protein